MTKSTFLVDLSCKTHHPLKSVFDNYYRVKIAKYLDIHPVYLSKILNGCMLPSDDLEDRMQNLSQQIIEAENKL